jgi:agmatinase
MNEFTYPHFLASEIENSKITEAAFSVLPVPFEKSVSYGGGAVQGPSSILVASEQLETWDGFSNPSALGIHTCAAIDCNKSDQQVIEDISQSVSNIITAGSVPVVLGGEHTVTYGVIKGFLNSDIKDFGVVQIDAHADLRDAYENNPLSHASVMKRVVDEGIPLYQLGIRAFCEEEIQTRKQFNVRYQDAQELVVNNIQSITLPEDFPEKVFFTLDIDGMDPSVFPSTGTPVPGGLAWYQTLSLFESVAKQREIIGFDLMEFAPIEGFHAYDFSAALLLYKMMGIVSRNS